jgi:hypothetical protein
MRSGEPFPSSTNVVAVLRVLRFQEQDKVPLVLVQRRAGLYIGKKSVDRPDILWVLAHRVKKVGASGYFVLSSPKFLLKVLPQIVPLVLTDVILSCDVIDD